MCRFRGSWRTETTRCCVLVYLGRVRVGTGRVRYLWVVKNISFCDLISVVQVLDLFDIVYHCFSDYLCVEFFICLENSSSNRFRILSCKFSETPIHPPSRRILGPFTHACRHAMSPLCRPALGCSAAKRCNTNLVYTRKPQERTHMWSSSMTRSVH